MKRKSGLPMVPVHPREAARLEALLDLDILDTAPEDHFTAICETARDLFQAPIALVSLVTETDQWFKGRCGIGLPGTARGESFCTHTVVSDEVLVVEDAARDPRFRDSLLVAGAERVRFYAGAPLEVAPGLQVGSLCVMDRVPRRFTARQRGQLQNLARIVTAQLRLHKTERLLREREARLAHLARHDPLTGLPNRLQFRECLQGEIARAQRGHDGFALHCLDLDRFKAINDSFGHHAGDRLLQSVADRLRGAVRDEDVVARLGGDEFVVIQPGADRARAITLAQRLIAALSSPFDLDGHERQIGVSIGIALAAAGPVHGEALHTRADKALYAAKASGRCTFRFAQTVEDGAREPVLRRRGAA